MALTGLHTNWKYGSYEKDRNEEIKAFENPLLKSGGSYGLTAYYDGSIAIGYGFDLLVRNNSEINSYLAAIGLGALSTLDAQLLDQARAQRDTGTATQASLTAIKDQLSLNLGTEPTAEALLNKYILDRAEPDLDAWLNGLGLSLPQSQERAALVSLAYNNPALLGDALGRAMVAGDRAEAFYEIAYNSNGGASRSPGIANRRYREADLFGMYNTSPTEADYKAAYRMFTRHKETILGADLALGGTDGYEDKFPPPEAGMSIFWQLKAARDYLLPLYDQGVAIAWSNIQVGEDASTSYYRGTDIDFLIGNDTNPSFANELIFGESGNDILQGGLGQDVLYGGTGVDIYRYRPNDGADIIIDSSSATNDSGGDGKGAILYDPDGTPQILAVGTRQAQSDGSYTGPWQSLDQTITYTLNGNDLTITTPGGTITVKDFNRANNDLNIRLIDLPVEPPAALRLAA